MGSDGVLKGGSDLRVEAHERARCCGVVLRDGLQCLRIINIINVALQPEPSWGSSSSAMGRRALVHATVGESPARMNPTAANDGRKRIIWSPSPVAAAPCVCRL